MQLVKPVKLAFHRFDEDFEYTISENILGYPYFQDLLSPMYHSLYALNLELSIYITAGPLTECPESLRASLVRVIPEVLSSSKDQY